MSIKINEIRIHEESSTGRKGNRKGLNFLNFDISITGKKINDKKKENFYSELGVLLASGVDLKTALEIITKEQKKGEIKRKYEKIYEYVIEGDNLSNALEKSSDFSAYEVNSIRIGEESSKMNDVLGNLTTYFSKKIKQRRQLTNAFSYPVIVLVTATAAVYFMMNFMVPMFEDVFKRFGGELPGITKSIIKLSNYFTRYFFIFILSVLILSFYLYFIRKKNWFRSVSSKIALSLPLAGQIIKLIYLERFFQSMALLSGAKIPLLRAIKLVRDMVSYYPFEVKLDGAREDLMHGKLLHESLSDFKLMDNKIISLIKVGEETNQLNFIFDRLQKQHSEELEFRIGMISNLLEPFIIVFVGLLVGLILISMYLPMFRMSTSIM